MLQVRTRRLPDLSGFAPLTQFWDSLVAADPGLARLSLAVRGTLAVFLTTVAALFAAHLLAAPVVEFASGITFSMMGPFLTREPTLRQRQRSLLLLALPAAGAAAATAVLHGYGVLGDSTFLLLVFVFFLLHPVNPRVIGIGLVAVVGTYVGLYLELPPASLPTQILSVLLALAVTSLVCFVLVPVDPAATLRRTIRAVQWRAARVLHAATGQPGDLVGVRRHLARLNEAILVADDLLALVQPDGRTALREGLIGLELQTARLMDQLAAEAPTPRQSLRLRLHERRMQRGHRYSMQPGQLEPGSLRAALVAVGHSVHALGPAASSLRTDAAGPAAAPPGPLAWRMATRVSLAAALAMAGGMALSPQRWFWAVLTVYVVFLNARSRGDTIYRGIQRLGGTVLGIVSGLLLATGLAGHTALELATLLGAVFGMYYFITTSYTLGIFCVTVMLGLLYGVMGASLESLLVLRLEETAIGAAAAVAVAVLVLPVRTRDQVQRSGRAVLLALADALGCIRAGSGGIEAMRRVDRQVADLRLALAPLTVGRSLLRRRTAERAVPALLEAVHWTRALAVSDAVDDGRLAAVQTVLAGLAQGDHPPHSHPAGGADERVNKLEAAVDTLAARIDVGALHAFGLGGA